MDTIETPELNQVATKLPDGYEVKSRKHVIEETFTIPVDVGPYWSETSISTKLNRYDGTWKVEQIHAMPQILGRVLVCGVRIYEAK